MRPREARAIVRVTAPLLGLRDPPRSRSLQSTPVAVAMHKLWSASLALLLATHAESDGAESFAPSPQPALASVSGIVFDSVAARPLDGARVQLVATDDPSRTRTTLTRTDGTFRFDSVPSGTWLAGFYHSALDQYGVEVPLERVRVIGTTEVHTTLAIPSARVIIDNACGASDGQDAGLYVGFVRTTNGSPPKRRGHVQVQWNAYKVEAKGIALSTPTLEVETSEQGGFTVCGVPRGGIMVARAWAGTDSSGYVELEVSKVGLLRHDLVVAGNRTVDVGVRQGVASDSLAQMTTRVSRGDGTLKGRITHSGGAPIRDARVVLWGSGIEVTTNGDGQFTMSDLPLGSWTLEARALGFVRTRQAVDISENDGAPVNVKLDAVTAVLDTVRVLGQRIVLPPDMRDFERRRKAGFGTFIDEMEIERRHALYVSDLFRMVPGISVVPTGMFSHAIVMLGRTLGATVVEEEAPGKSKSVAGCVPAFFIDGLRVDSRDGDIEMFVSTAEIRAIEIYARASNVPAEFNTTSGCGSILVHTGPHGTIRPQP